MIGWLFFLFFFLFWPIEPRDFTKKPIKRKNVPDISNEDHARVGRRERGDRDEKRDRGDRA